MDYPSVVEYAKYKCEQFLNEGNGPGIGIAIVTKDSVLLCQGHGLEDVEKETKFTSSTVTLLASVSKTISGTLVGMLAKSCIGPDLYQTNMDMKTSDTYVTNNLKVQDCLSHRAGIPEQYGTYNRFVGYTRSSIIRNLPNVSNSDFRNSHKYTNIPFTHAVEKAINTTGISLDTAYNRLFRTLNMPNTSINYLPSKYKGYYQLDKDEWYPLFDYNVEEQVSAGGIYSTVEDMSMFLQFHLQQLDLPDDEKEVSPEFYKGVYTKADGSIQGTGININFHTTNGVSYRLFGHSGALSNVRSRIIFSSELDFGLYIVTNSAVNAFAEVLSVVLLDILLGITIQEADEKFESMYEPTCDVFKEQIIPLDFNVDGVPINRIGVTGVFHNDEYQDVTIYSNGSISLGKLRPVKLHLLTKDRYDFLLFNKFDVPYRGILQILNSYSISIEYWSEVRIFTKI